MSRLDELDAAVKNTDESFKKAFQPFLVLQLFIPEMVDVLVTLSRTMSRELKKEDYINTYREAVLSKLRRQTAENVNTVEKMKRYSALVDFFYSQMQKNNLKPPETEPALKHMLDYDAPLYKKPEVKPEAKEEALKEVKGGGDWFTSRDMLHNKL